MVDVFGGVLSVVGCRIFEFGVIWSVSNELNGSVNSNFAGDIAFVILSFALELASIWLVVIRHVAALFLNLMGSVC